MSLESMKAASGRNGVTPFVVENRWCVHAYYTMPPTAPDGSGRLLVAAADLERAVGEVLVLSEHGEVQDRFGAVPLHAGFFHTGLWQTWAPDARSVYFQSGSLCSPSITRRDLRSGKEVTIDGDMEGAPPDGEPILSGLMGMLYAAGYGGGGYRPDLAPAPFEDREAHGLFEYTLEPGKKRLRRSVAEILECHPRRDWLLSLDKETGQRLGAGQKCTLMTYCVRWNRDASRCLFYFGNHCVDRSRGEPKIAFIMTADREMKEMHLALDLCEKGGDHWSWQPDGVSLIGNGPDPDGARVCIAQVRFDGTGYQKLVGRKGGGHPSVSPVDPDWILTDERTETGGAIQVYSRNSGNEIFRCELQKFLGKQPLPGRNSSWVCHHPVFDQSGKTIFFNHMSHGTAALGKIPAPVA